MGKCKVLLITDYSFLNGRRECNIAAVSHKYIADFKNRAIATGFYNFTARAAGLGCPLKGHFHKNHRMLSSISVFLLRLFGWRVLGRYPAELPKVIIVVVPHTSNWDFPLGLLVRATLKTDIRFIGKSSLFRPPFGWFFRWLGGYPVEQHRRTNFVKMMTEIYQEEPRFHSVIAPEGTRSRVERLKTGFYHIAVGGGAAIVLCRFDWGRKVVEFREPFFPSGNMEADFQLIDDYFRGIKGKHPSQGYLYEG
jgi:1-acyl-sn-glycerol-3-phosphate acyltransferase